MKFNSRPSPTAVIDVGTNTVRLLIGYRDENGKAVRLQSYRRATRLGKGIRQNGFINPDSFNKTISCLSEVKAICEQYSAKNIYAFGTSALREASNAGHFVHEVMQSSGITIDVISGAMEAELTYRGICAGGLCGPEPLFAVDIGGGSTEWILERPSKSIDKGSMEIGAVKLYEQFIDSDPPEIKKLDELQEFIRLELLNNLPANIVGSMNFVATGGTAAALACIKLELDMYDGEKVHTCRIDRPSLTNMVKCLCSMTLAERTRVSGLEADRADIIIPGMYILKSLMEYLKSEQLTISDYGLLEGALIARAHKT